MCRAAEFDVVAHFTADASPIQFISFLPINLTKRRKAINLRQLVAYGVNWAERSHRFSEDQGDESSVDRAHQFAVWRLFSQVDVLCRFVTRFLSPNCRPRLDLSRIVDNFKDGPADSALTTPTLGNDTKSFALVHVETDHLDRLGKSFVRREICLYPVDR